ncbi:hypothetical protein [Chitinophaga defluvii]|uniref:DUF4397 domain-containing protein n=1 Tax=Chitinophaga defluvii TaxID=3163343 RepID=A0ABV2T6N3_9BACT
MNMNSIKNKIKRWFSLALFCCMATACKKNVEAVLPDNQQDIRVNYYGASDVLPETDLNVDISLLLDGKQYQQYQAAFRFESDNDIHVYPRTFQNSDDRQIGYARYVAQPYRFAFAGENIKLVDTLLNLEPATFHCLYLTDVLTAQNSAPKYGLLAVKETRQAIPDGQIGVRFINLSPETNSLEVVLTTVGGNDRPLAATAFLKASEYSYLDPKDATEGLLRFKLTDTDGSVIYTAVPATAGRSYAVIAQGFKTDQRRQIANGNGQGVSTLTISNNLRALVRRTY